MLYRKGAAEQSGLAPLLTKVGENVRAFFANFPNSTSVERIHTDFLYGDGRPRGDFSQEYNYLMLAASEKGRTYQLSFCVTDNRGYSTKLGIPCNLSRLSTNRDVTDTQGNGIDVLWPWAATQPPGSSPPSQTPSGTNSTLSICPD